MKKKTIIFEVIIIFLFSVFMIIWNVGCKNIVCNIYGGVEYNYGDINVLAMGKWLFVFAMYFLITGYEMLNNQRMFLFEIYRYKNYKTWWRNYFFNTQFSIFLIYIFSALELVIIEQRDGISLMNDLLIIVFFYMHLQMYISILICSGVLFKNSICPGVLVVFEGLLYVFSVSDNNLIGISGMYIRLKNIDNTVYSGIGIGIIEAVISIVLFLAVKLLISNEKCERLVL